MKKYLVFLVAVLISISIFAQKNPKRVKAQKAEFHDSWTQAQNPNMTNSSAQAAPAYGTEVGITAYDYQCNGTMQRRVVTDPLGNITVVWTDGTILDPAGPNRRIGYNYYNKATGIWAGEDTTGGGRRGWPSLASSQGPEDIIFSHSPQRIHTRPAAGSGAFTHIDLSSKGITGTTFASTAAWGDTIHHISEIITLDSIRAFQYSRSPDNGNSWDVANVLLPGINAGNFKNDYVSGDGIYGMNARDAFQIDARGDVVAIVTGGWKQPTHLFKSTDRGQTWNYDQVFVYDTSCAEVLSNGNYISRGVDDSYAIAIDKNGKVHIAGGMVSFESDSGTNGAGNTFYPFDQGLIYWNEDRGYNLCLNDPLTYSEIVLTEFVDEDGNGVNSTPTSYDSVGRYYNHGLISFPGIALRDTNTVVLTWSGVREDINVLGITLQPSNYDGLSRYHRDLYVWGSSDGGNTWEIDSIKNIADDIAGAGFGFGSFADEEVYLYSYPRISADSLIHIVFQSGKTGGTNITNAASFFSDVSIVYYEIPLSTVLGIPPPCISPVLNSVSINHDSICQGETVSISINGTLNSAPVWSSYYGSCGGTYAGGSFGNTILLTPTNSTTIYVRGEGGCVSPGSCDSVSITVIGQDTAWAQYPKNTYCAGEPDPVPVILGTAGGVFTSSPGLVVDSLTGQVYLGQSSPGYFYKIYYTTKGFCPDTATIGFQYSVPDTTILYVGDSGLTTATIYVVDHQWLYCDSNFARVPGATSKTFFPTVTGNYAVELTQVGNCIDTSSCYFVSVNSLQDVTQEFDLVLYPNPTESLVMIEFENENQDADIQIIDSKGMIRNNHSDISTDQTRLDLSELEPGVYWVRVFQKDKVGVKKLVVE